MKAAARTPLSFVLGFSLLILRLHRKRGQSRSRSTSSRVQDGHSSIGTFYSESVHFAWPGFRSECRARFFIAALAPVIFFHGAARRPRCLPRNSSTRP